jgi:hypothetical protein
VGGDDLGARVLGSLAGVLAPGVTDLLFVVNTRRPFAHDLAALRRALVRIQAAARLAVTGLIANTHLLGETTPAMIREGIRVARQLEAATGIPLRCCCMLQDVTAAFGDPAGAADRLGILAMERRIVPPFAARPAGAARRSAVV